MSFLGQIKTFMDNSILDELLFIAMMIAVTESIAQNNIKNSDKMSLLFIVGLLFYIVVGYLLHYAYHKFPLGKLNVVWSCMSIIIAMTLGYLLYDEPFNRWSVLAMFFALSAIYCSFRASNV